MLKWQIGKLHSKNISLTLNHKDSFAGYSIHTPRDFIISSHRDINQTIFGIDLL